VRSARSAAPRGREATLRCSGVRRSQTSSARCWGMPASSARTSDSR
jgi:hypothetical protein